MGLEECKCNCKTNEAHLDTIRAIANAHQTELAVMKTIIDNLAVSLFGDSSHKGVVTEMKDKVEKHDKFIWIIMGVIVTMNFLSGNGVVSLKALIGK